VGEGKGDRGHREGWGRDGFSMDGGRRSWIGGLGHGFDIPRDHDLTNLLDAARWTWLRLLVGACMLADFGCMWGVCEVQVKWAALWKER